MEYDLGWLVDIGVDVDKGLEYTRHIDKYIELVRKYYKDYETNYNNVTGYYNNKDWKNYCILVHSLKSNSKMIGITKFAVEFEKLEIASRNEDAAAIDTLHNTTIEEWSAFARKLSPIEEYIDDELADEINYDEARQIIDKLKVALDDFDDVASKNLIEKLYGYSFSTEQKKRLDEASEYIADFLYDDALEVISDIESSMN